MRQTRGQLSPHYVDTTLNIKGNKKGVQFRNPESDLGYNYSPRVYNPILITPRHPYTKTPVIESERPKRVSSPSEDPSDSRGRYFSGTMENGQGRDFYGFYFSPRASIDPAIKRTLHLTSTPNVDNHHPDRSIISRQTGHLIPRKLFLKVRDSTPLQRERYYGESEIGGDPRGSHHYGNYREHYEVTNPLSTLIMGVILDM